MSSEKNFYQQIRRNIEKPGTHLQRIESSTGPGIPDVNYCHIGHEGWFELKAWENSRRTGMMIVPKLRPEQVAWAWKRRKSGGKVHFLFKVDETIMAFDGFLGASLLQRQVSWTNAQACSSLWIERPFDWSSMLRLMQAPMCSEDELKLRLQNYLVIS